MAIVYASVATDDFWDLYRDLPPQIKHAAREAYANFEKNAKHPALNFKRLVNHSDHVSARVNKQYRVLGLWGDPIVWFFIGTHADYDRLIRNL